MTYLQFHLRFNLPLLLLLAGITWVLGLFAALFLPIVILCAIVLAFTFPWDNWAVKDGIWGFPEDRILARISYLPVEEILFFIIQTIQVAMLCTCMLQLYPAHPDSQVSFTPQTTALTCILVLLLVILFLSTKGYRKRTLQIRYAWHLLFWFMPVILLQWIIASNILTSRLGAILGSSLIVGLYLTFADSVAIKHGIWFFDKKRITGHYITSEMPWEEGAFFFITSLLVAQSIVLLLPSQVR